MNSTSGRTLPNSFRVGTMIDSSTGSGLNPCRPTLITGAGAALGASVIGFMTCPLLTEMGPASGLCSTSEGSENLLGPTELSPKGWNSGISENLGKFLTNALSDSPQTAAN